MTASLLYLTRNNDSLAKLVAEQLERRKLRGHSEIQLVTSDKKEEQRKANK